MYSNTIKRSITGGLSGLLLLMATTVWGLGLGNLDLKSRLNQRFSANIPVIGVDSIDVTNINVRLADKEQFEWAGLNYTGAGPAALRFTSGRTEDGLAVIMVTSESRVTEPLVSFVLEVEQGGTRTTRQYAAMMEAPIR